MKILNISIFLAFGMLLGVQSRTGLASSIESGGSVSGHSVEIHIGDDSGS